MEPFRTVRSTVTPLPEPNVDTDQIIPKQFLKRVSRSGFGRFLFYDRRQAQDGRMFVLDDPAYAGSRILVAGDNFGCGSSREHAVWALKDFGFAAVVSTSFADIFYSNCVKNGVLPVRLPAPDRDRLMAERGEVVVDLERQTIRTPSRIMPFPMDPYKRVMLMEGLDEIAQTLRHESQIAAFEEASAVPSVR